MVPLGVRDEPQMETVKLFCPKCQDVYVHPSHAAQSELVFSWFCWIRSSGDQHLLRTLSGHR